MKRWLLIGLGAVLLVAAGGAAGLYIKIHREAQDIRGSSTEEFVPTELATTVEAPKPREIAGVVWPFYGFQPERLRVVGFDHRPPYRVLWRFGARNLVEFPPVIAYERLYFANNSGRFYAVNAKTGKRAWKFDSGRCVAASPAVNDHVVFMTFLNRRPCNRGNKLEGLTGEVIAFSAGFGKIRWRKMIGPSESSPLVANGRVYVGDWTGRVYALDEKTGKTVWTYRTRNRIKSGVTLSGNRLYVGSYDHNVYALNARTGKLIWRTEAQERLFGRATFYSTPAAAYGRVYVGGTDGKVYSFGAASGKIRWTHSTGGFVYSSPAVWNRTVYAGSYSGRFYALDAATGDVTWRFKANGPISGSPTVMNGVVYFATLKERTYALNARTGKVLWTFPDGKYTPVVADDERVYLVGHARVYGLVER
jgi:outer membrane protein assembly factor BamB